MSTYTPIASQTLSSAAATVTFSGIPQTYTDLVVVTNVLASGSFYVANINGDTGNNYSRTRMLGNGSTAASDRSTNLNSLIIDNSNSTNWTMATIHFMNYSNTTTNKTILSRGNGAAYDVSAMVHLWRNTAAITSISFTQSSNFSAGSTFTLYGIGAGSPKAFGGDIVVQSGGYWYHAFLSSGVFSPTQSLSCDVLVVAGGGAGGHRSSRGGGGGGAGGVLFSTQTLSGSQAITIGAGGTGIRFDGVNQSTSGTASRVGTLVEAVGGGFGDNLGTQGGTGGSGGGNAGLTLTTTAGGLGTSGQGNNGGQSWFQNPGASANYAGGGGGGATAVGVTATSSSAPPNGGAGTSAYSAWGLATTTGQNISGTVWYAGGGGGAYGNQDASSSFTAGSGGNGGGGAGNSNTTGNATNGTANTGGGGGGLNGVSNGLPGNGGSGIVIVRYAV